MMVILRATDVVLRPRSTLEFVERIKFLIVAVKYKPYLLYMGFKSYLSTFRK